MWPQTDKQKTARATNVSLKSGNEIPRLSDLSSEISSDISTFLNELYMNKHSYYVYF